MKGGERRECVVQRGAIETKIPARHKRCGDLFNVAVKERFELSIQFLVYTLSRRAP